MQAILALDLKSGDIVVKLYLYPMLKSATAQTPISQLVLNALRRGNNGIFRDASATTESYLHTAPPSLEMVRELWESLGIPRRDTSNSGTANKAGRSTEPTHAPVHCRNRAPQTVAPTQNILPSHGY
ncbi:hypothetical protein EYZ11_004125 [Aspergillus tanneri]|uniref:Uncharacterized protein n=1 Tax=Aspergillus tanneri TaxID=1220188 RepID=A0A4S3JS72_9EURO|nr:hypothetical protein EYZ11_004125 [Aspergillus tanneri]